METEIPKARRKGATHDEEHHRLGPCGNETQLEKETLSLDDVIEEPLPTEDLDEELRVGGTMVRR